MKKRRLSPEEKSLLAIDRELEEEKVRQINMLYPAAAITLWQQYGWRTQRIMNRFRTSMLTYDECGAYGAEKSMIQMFEEETGIEMKLDGYDYSYHQFSYLDGTKWNRKLLPISQLVLMKRKQKPWIAPVLLSGLCLALHRDEGFGFERLTKFIGFVDQIRKELGDKSTEPYAQKMKEITGIDINDLWDDRKFWGE